MVVNSHRQALDFTRLEEFRQRTLQATSEINAVANSVEVSVIFYKYLTLADQTFVVCSWSFGRT